MAKYKKYWIPLALIISVLFLAYFFGIYEYFTFTSLKDNQAKLVTLVSEHQILAPIVFILIYVVTSFFLLPVGPFLSVAGGLLFPWVISIIYSSIGATAGACLLFLATKTAMSSLFKRLADPRLKKIERELQNGEVNYLLFLRLIPLSPFGLVSLAAAFFGVHFWTFTWTTLVGNAPTIIAFAEIGREFGLIINSGKELSASTLLNWKIILALIVLSILSILPLLIKKRRSQ